MKKLSLVFVFILLFFSTLLGQNKLGRKQLREETSKKEYFEIKELVESGVYKFVVEKVNPIRSSSIIFRGDGYFLTINKDSVDTYLPYFGVRHSGGGFGETDVIQILSPTEDYNVEYEDDKKRIIVKFIGKNKGEIFDVTLSIFKSGSSSLSINSINRRTINYSGKLTKIKKDDKKSP